jgi:hypothetical protein
VSLAMRRISSGSLVTTVASWAGVDWITAPRCALLPYVLLGMHADGAP